MVQFLPLLLFPLLAGQDPTEAAQKLISQLDAETVEQRDEAARKLKAIGHPARAALEAALRDPRVEVAGRARAILNELFSKWAAETYQAIEAAALGAKTVQVQFKAEIRDQERSGNELLRVIKGSILLKDNNRVRIDITQRAEETTLSRSLHSDGKTLWTGKGGDPIGLPEGFRSNLTKELIQGGAADWFTVITFFRRDGSTFKDHRPLTFPPDPPSEPDAAGLRSIRYAVTQEAPEAPLQVTLTFDAKTLRLVKRVSTDDGRRLRSVTTETYTQYLLDGDLPDERFGLPADK